jgi:hypothetical protein
MYLGKTFVKSEDHVPKKAAANVRRRRIVLLAGIAGVSAALTFGAVNALSAVGVYTVSVAAGAVYTSGGYSLALSDQMTNNNQMNIGNGYLEIFKNGAGLVRSNYPGQFVSSTQTIVIYTPGGQASIVGKCKSSNSRQAVFCGIY